MRRPYRPRPRTYGLKVPTQPCRDCGECLRPNEPLIIHIPGCRHQVRQTQPAESRSDRP